MRNRITAMLLAVVGLGLAILFLAIGLRDTAYQHPPFVWGRLFAVSVGIMVVSLSWFVLGTPRFQALGLLQDERKMRWTQALPWKQAIALLAVVVVTLCAWVVFDILWCSYHA